MRRLLVLLVPLLMTAPAYAASAKKEPAPQQRPLTLPKDRPMGIAAVVNDDVITSQDVEDRALMLMALTGTGATPDARAQLVSKSLSMLIDEALELQEAKRNSINVTDEEVENALAELEKKRGRPPGSLASFFRANDLSMESIRRQFKSEIAWRKTVLKKLRSNIAVTEAEIARAQQTAANPRNIPQVLITAITVPITLPEKEKEAAAKARSLADELTKGKSFEDLARESMGKPDVRVVPALWLNEDQLEPAVAQALRALGKGATTQPLRSLSTYQIVRILDRREVPPVSPNTEVAVKQMQLSLADNAKKSEVETLMSIAKAVQENPGSCGEKGIAGIESFEGLNITVNYLRTRYKEMSPEMLQLVQPLGVGDTTAPYATRNGLELLMLCEKIEAPLGPPDRETVKTKLIGERAELEAEKMLRNLRRDAFVDVRSGNKE